MRLSGIRQDIAVGLRGFLRSPGFATAALVTLALGVGATAAIFTVVRAALLAPLPYAEADRRVMIWSRWISTWSSHCAKGHSRPPPGPPASGCAARSSLPRWCSRSCS